jgi:hypothetical protein
MPDRDLAELYGVETRTLNQAVRRNLDRFPADFLFQLTKQEAEELLRSRSQTVILKRGGNVKYLPYAFIEHGSLMAANILNSKRAVQTSTQVVRAFIRMRQVLASTTELAEKLRTLEKRYDSQFKVVFDSIRQLMSPPEPSRREMGFHVKGEPITKPKLIKVIQLALLKRASGCQG